MIDVERFRADIERLLEAACLVSVVDVPGLLRRIDRAKTLGPFVAPDLWRQKREALHEDQEVLEAVLPLWRLAQKLTGEERAEKSGESAS